MKAILSLVLRRLGAFAINVLIIFFILSLLYVVIAGVLWFCPFRSSLHLTYFSVTFCLLYSMLGDMGLLKLPSLSKHMLGLKIIETRKAFSKPFKAIIRIGTYYFSLASAFLYLASIFLGIDSKEKGLFWLPFSTFISYFQLLIPISILVGRGEEGLHDRLAGVKILTQKGASSGEVKGLLSKSLSVTLGVAIILMLLTTKQLFSSGLINTFYHPPDASIMEVIHELDTIVPETPIESRKYEPKPEILKWWVDISDKPQMKVKIGDHLGLKGLDVVFLEGYGYSIAKTVKPISLISLDQDKRTTLQQGSDLLTLHFFVGSGFLYRQELVDKITSYAINRLTSAYKLVGAMGAIRIKITQIVKAGYWEVGFFNEVYFVRTGGFWRDVKNTFFPVIFTIDTRFASDLFGSSLISPMDID